MVNFNIAQVKQSARIADVWAALGGGKLRGNRGQAWWRGGDGFSVALDFRRGVWFDHVAGTGGDVIALVEVVRGCDFRTAVEWLADHLGITIAEAASTGTRTCVDTAWATDLKLASWWRIAAVALAETTLESLSDMDPQRYQVTQFLAALSLGPATLVGEFRGWRRRDPRLTHAMVRAGRCADARLQRRLALWLLRGRDGQAA